MNPTAIPAWFVVVMGMGIVFAGLICIVFLCMLMSRIVMAMEAKSAASAVPVPTAVPVPAAAAAPDATEDIIRKSLASVELMQEINGFVNVDLMNP